VEKKKKEERTRGEGGNDALHLYMPYTSYYGTFNLSSDHFENNKKQKSLLSSIFKPSSSLSLS
jgi:hypothetical protein